MPNALHDFASNLASPNRFSNLSDWTSQPQHQHYPVPVSGQQFLPPSYSGHSILPPAYSGQNDLSHMTRDQSASFVNKLSSPDAFAASSFDSLARSSLPQTFQPNQFHQQLQLAQMISAQQPHQQLPFASPQYSQSPQPAPTSQPTYQPLRVSRSLPSDMPSFDQLRGSAMPPSDSAYQREQAPFSIGAQLGITSYPNTTNSSSLNTSMPSDPRAASLSTQSLSYTNLSFPTAHGVMSSHELASFAAVLGTRTNAVHEWLTDNSAPPGIAVHQGPFVTSLDTRLPLPPSPASASLASPATANTSISSSLDGSEVPSGPVAVRSASGALSSPSSASPTVSPKDTSNTVAGGKRVRDESVLSLSQLADQEIERHLRFSQNSLSLSSLSSHSNPVSPSISSSSIARVPTPSGTLSQSFTTISLSSMGPSEASDPSSYLFQRPSPSAGPSASSSTASLPECASVSSLIFNRSHQPQRFTPSSRFGSSPQMPISLDDSASDGSTSPSKKIKSGPAAFPSPLSSSISLPSSSSYPTSGVPSLTWPAQSPASRQYPSPPASSPSGSAYPFNAVPTNRPSKKAGKAESKGPKNPRSAYVYFVADQRKKLARTETLANSTFQEVASALGARWRGLSPEERRPFEEMARRDKERYQTEKTRSFEDM